ILLDHMPIGDVSRESRNFMISNLLPETTYIVEVIAIGFDGKRKNTSWGYELTTKALPSGEVVTFKDIHLENSIRDELGIRHRELRESDLLELRRLTIYEGDISSLSGLEYATNLQRLTITENNISDISQLSTLINLQSLNLSYNSISNIEVLLELPSLYFVSLWGNPIDISIGSRSMEIIEELEVREIEVSLSRPEVYSGHTTDGSVKLVWDFPYETSEQIDSYDIYVNGTVKENVKANNNYYRQNFTLVGLDSDTSYEIYIVGLIDGIAYARTNRITITTKRQSTGPDVIFKDEKLIEIIRERLGIYHRNIKVDDMEQLHWLGINSEVTDLTGLETAINLYELWIYNTEITNFDVLSKLKNLEDLTIENGSSFDISVLKGLRYLSYLDISYTNVNNLNDLDGLSNLWSLHLANINIDNITSLSSLTNLRTLNLSNNNISDVSSLKGLDKLRNLNLSNNSINDISSLKDLYNLRFLDLSNNRVEDLTPLKNLDNLVQVYLHYNKIVDISTLLSVNNLQYVTLFRNLLDVTEGSATFDVIEKLRDHGVYVQFEEWFYPELVITEITANSITIDLEASASGNGYTRFSIFVNGEFIADVDGSVKEYVINALEPDTKYNIVMYLGYDEWDAEELLAVVRTLPLETLPSEPPTAPTVAEVTDKSTTVTGMAEAGSTVKVSKGTEVIGTTTAKEDGTYEVSIARQVAGTTLVVTATDLAGNESVGTSVVVKDVTAPATPTVAEVTDKSTTVTGKAEAGSTVTVKVGTKTLGTAKATSSGTFSINIARQKAGAKLAITATDEAGNISKVRNTTVKDVTPPNTPTVNEVTDKSTTVTGTAEAGSTVTVRVGTKVLGTAKATSKGTFSIKIARQKAGVKLAVTATDEAGNTSKVRNTTVKDVTPPNTPTVNKVTNKSVSVTGKSEKGATVYIYNGKKKLGQAVVDSKGNFSVKITAQKKGAKLTIYAQDKAKNKSKSRVVTVG
ncbi:MAG: Ig-like domain-containing protein, partial [Anaerobacillus sp.]|uniref:Ig-like domain-containing protein n=1 Tax=Anaerobacillus sp. TaxID=1872506 RepID=UPI00391A161E